jgi:hypothetical protein
MAVVLLNLDELGRGSPDALNPASGGAGAAGASRCQSGPPINRIPLEFDKEIDQ